MNHPSLPILSMTAAPTTSSPADAAQRLIGRPYLSWSAVSTYRSCPLKFHFRYVAQLPEPMVSSSLIFGSAIHAAIELILRSKLDGGSTPTGEGLLAAYDTVWSGSDGRLIDFAKGETAKTLRELAARMFSLLLRKTTLLSLGQILGVEEELSTTLIGDVPPILARLDLLTESDDGLVVTDFKTARSRWSAAQVEQNSEQLLLYAQVAGNLIGRKVARLRFVVLTKTKQPDVVVHEIAFDPVAATRTQTIVARVWRAIEAGHFFPAPSPLNCSCCPYRKPCRRWPE